MNRFKILLLCVLAGIIISETAVTAEKYADVTVNILTFPGPFLAEPVERRAMEFAEATGATINVTKVKEYNDLYKMMLADFSSGKNQYHVAVYPAMWTPDFAQLGYLEDITDRVSSDAKLQWNDVVPFFRKFITTYNEHVYSIPLDGDFHMMYYRKDILDKAGLKYPRTWNDYIKVAATIHGQDMNGDGEPDYGSCISREPEYEAYWYFLSIAAAFLQSEGTSQGIFFDTRNMKPLVNNEAFEAAINIYLETAKYGPLNELEMNTPELHNLFIEGRCGLAIGWGDIGIMSIGSNSKVKDRVGAAILPGSPRVLDRNTGKIADCDTARCPYAINKINHAPFAAFGGSSGSINAASDTKTKEAAYAFLSYMSQPKQSNTDVTLGITACNPYRFSQFKKAAPWIKAGMSKDTVKSYLGAIGKSLNSPNMVLDLKIIKSHSYLGGVLDGILNKLLTGKLNKKQAMAKIEKGWEDITDKIGRDKQLRAYLLSLGRKVK
ncbi:extracellular solute-binding protein [Candidatus Halobeggiatoa sp. HSG11]|nr:extracellular solute-binding protein [Candidatus Halobeggiatoa sp. HSG11]